MGLLDQIEPVIALNDDENIWFNYFEKAPRKPADICRVKEDLIGRERVLSGFKTIRGYAREHNLRAGENQPQIPNDDLRGLNFSQRNGVKPNGGLPFDELESFKESEALKKVGPQETFVHGRMAA